MRKYYKFPKKNGFCDNYRLFSSCERNEVLIPDYHPICNVIGKEDEGQDLLE